jgi:hypothetical protein
MANTQPTLATPIVVLVAQRLLAASLADGSNSAVDRRLSSLAVTAVAFHSGLE